MNLPIKHLSASSIRSFLNNQREFYFNYIAKVYSDTEGLALVEGKIIHNILENFWTSIRDKENFDKTAILEKYLKELNSEKINWNVESEEEKEKKKIKTKKQIENTIDFYLNELPPYASFEIVSIEEPILIDSCEKTNVKIALKGVCDLIIKDINDDLVIIDHKTVSVFKQEGKIDLGFELQACFYYFLILEKYGVKPKKMIFDQIKKTKNRDGSQQLVSYVVNYEEKESLLKKWLELVDIILNEIENKQFKKELYLPNFFVMFGGEQVTEDFIKE
jgi:RecB family exonuclease